MAQLRHLPLILFCIFFPLLSFGQFEIIYQPSLKDGGNPPTARECKKIFNSCATDSIAKSKKQHYEIASKTCAQQNQKLGCDQLIKTNPAIASKVRNCSPQGLCLQDTPSGVREIKSCFWNAPKEFGIDMWEMVIDGAGMAAKTVNQCTTPKGFVNKAISIWKCQAPVYWIYSAYQNFPNKEQAWNQAQKIYNSGEEWVKKQGVQLDCYTPEAQMEMICYGIISVFAPDKIVKVAKAIPAAVKLAGLERSANKIVKARLEALPERIAGGRRVVSSTTGRASVRAEQILKPKSIANTTPAPQVARKVAKPKIIPVAPATGGAATGVLAQSPRAAYSEAHLKSEVATPAQNEKWVSLANDLNPPQGTRFFDVENSAMKSLNDKTLDKNFVTALTNQHKELVANKMAVLAKKYPDVEFLPYSDFKSLRYALKPKPPATSLPYQLDSEVAKVFEASNKEFIQTLKDKKLVPDGEDPAWWFRSGWGDSADEATFSARYSRTAPSTNQMRRFTDSDLRESQGTTLKYAEAYRQSVQSSLRNTSLLEESTVPGKMIPKAEVFDAIRKTETAEQLASFLKKTTGHEITNNQANILRSYGQMTDEFSPGIHIVRREQAILDKKTGGITFDLVGAGSENSKATAEALVRSTDVETAVRETRIGERSVTENLTRRKNEVRNAVTPILEKYKIKARFIASGDDMALIPDKPLSDVVKKEIAQALAKGEKPSSIRMSTVGEGIADTTDRMVMATQGESVEKTTRKYLQGSLPKEVLDKTLISIQMEGQSVGTGNVRLILGEGMNLSDAQRKAFREAFEKAVKDLKSDYKPLSN